MFLSYRAKLRVELLVHHMFPEFTFFSSTEQIWFVNKVYSVLLLKIVPLNIESVVSYSFIGVVVLVSTKINH